MQCCVGVPVGVLLPPIWRQFTANDLGNNFAHARLLSGLGFAPIYGTINSAFRAFSDHWTRRGDGGSLADAFYPQGYGYFTDPPERLKYASKTKGHSFIKNGL